MNKQPDDLDRYAVRALFWIIIASILSIATLNGLAALLQADLLAGIFESIEQDPEAFTGADEALSILGNVAAAATGALAGWLTHKRVSAMEESAPPVPEAVSAASFSEPAGAVPVAVPDGVGAVGAVSGDVVDAGVSSGSSSTVVKAKQKESPVTEPSPEPVANDHPDDVTINPPEPVEIEDGSVEYPPDPDFTPEGNADDYDLTPVDADDDYSPAGDEEN